MLDLLGLLLYAVQVRYTIWMIKVGLTRNKSRGVY